MTHETSLKDLADNLRAAAQAYYDSDELLMSDAEYDSGIEQLRIAVAEDPTLSGEFTDLLDEVAAGQSAGGDVEHPTLMGSMDKVPTLDAVRDFVKKVNGPVVVEPKLDGLAVRAVYENGKLTLAATRGDGRTGENITQSVKQLNILPTTLKPTELSNGSVEVRGEVFMRDSNFPKANKVRTSEGSEEFVNTRNAASGILRRGDSRYAGLLEFAVYSTITNDAGDHLDVMELTTQAGLLTATSMVTVEGYSPDETTDVEKVIERIETIGTERDNLGFPIDGSVVKAVRTADRERLGEGSRAPNWAVAFKYEAEEGVTKVVGITTDVGRTGRLAPRIEVEPVFVGGTTITYASGHNVAWMQEKDIRVGDTVILRRANDVIPYISEVLLEHRPDDAEEWTPPEVDPLGRPWDKSTLLWRSTSPELSVLGRVVYAASRDCLDVDGVGVELVTALVDQGLVKDVADLFYLSEQQLAELELTSGRVVGKTVAAKLMTELEEAKKSDWNRVITALGIRATGRTMGRRLAAAFPTMERLRAAAVEDLAQVDGIATKKAEIIREGLDNLENTGELDRLADAGVNMGAEPDNTDAQAPAALDGESVVVTGKVPGLTRTEVQERIESLGGRASSSVSSTTTLLVAEPGSTSSKVKKAEKLGIRIITPEDFLAL